MDFMDFFDYFFGDSRFWTGLVFVSYLLRLRLNSDTHKSTIGSEGIPRTSSNRFYFRSRFTFLNKEFDYCSNLVLSFFRNVKTQLRRSIYIYIYTYIKDETYSLNSKLHKKITLTMYHLRNLSNNPRI